MAEPIINSLSWMIGPWVGKVGSDTVTETWSAPLDGCMDTSIRLSGPDAVRMLELIVIETVINPTGSQNLELHLMQFGPRLDLRTNQNLYLEDLTETKVSFIDEEGSSVRKLVYEALDSDQMQVSVTLATGDVLNALLTRP